MRWPRRAAPPLAFDFGPPRRRRGVLPWCLLGAALLIATDMGRVYREQRSALVMLTAQMRDLPAPRAMPVAYTPKDVDRELTLARATLQRMTLPWNGLFQALAACETEGVALLTIVPDAATGAVQITAEARDVPDMLNYLSRMEERSGFTGATLLRHERRSSPASPIVFIASAAWTGR